MQFFFRSAVQIKPRLQLSAVNPKDKKTLKQWVQLPIYFYSPGMLYAIATFIVLMAVIKYTKFLPQTEPAQNPNKTV
jgi:hypothetical protein